MYEKFALGLVVLNAVAFAVFAWDKHAAKNGLRRISERSLLTFALLGGSVGVMAGQRFLRHKTRKQPFRTILRLVVVLHILGFLAWLFLAGPLRPALQQMIS